MSKINWKDINTVELLYPDSREYVKKHRGFLCCPAKEEIKLWYEFREFIEKEREVKR